MSSEYFCSLTGEVKIRYIDKIKIIKNNDPFAFTLNELNANLEELPEVTTMDLVNYLILTHSFYSGQQLKAYKSLQAFKYFDAGFVQNIGFKKFDDAYAVVGEVYICSCNIK